MKLSNRVLSLGSSATLAMKARTKALTDQGIAVISLSAGEPDFPTPACIVQAAHKALDKGVGRYTAVRGNDELVTAMRLKFKRDQGLEYSATQVISSVGAKASLSLAIDALLDTGDEAIILTPYWVSYPELVKLAGATPVFAKPTLEAIKAALTPKTRVLLFNSPNNPDGAVFSQDFMRSMMKMLEGSNTWVISDEIYEHLLFDGAKHFSPASVSEDAYRRTVVINGVSKGYAMTGWRVGIAGGSEEAIGGMAKLQEQRYSCIPTICQMAAAYALTEPPELKTEIERMRSAYEHRRDVFFQELASLSGATCEKPQGAFYVFPNFASRFSDDVDLANRLLSEAHVATVPGTPFGMSGHLRISLASSLEDIVEGVRRIGKFLAAV